MPEQTPVTSTKQLFDALTQKLEETRTVLEKVAAKKIGDLTDFVELVLGPQVFDPDFNMALLEEPMQETTSPVATPSKEEVTIMRIRRASHEYGNALQSALDAEVKAHIFFEATHDYSAENPEHVFPHNVTDREASNVRLADLDEAFELFRPEYLDEGRKAVQAAVGRARLENKYFFKQEIDQGIGLREMKNAGEEIPQTLEDEETGERISLPREHVEMREDMLDSAKHASLRCGIAMLDAAAVTLALEVLRMTVKGAAIPDLDQDDPHLTAVYTARHGMELGGRILRNVTLIAPKLGQSLENGPRSSQP